MHNRRLIDFSLDPHTHGVSICMTLAYVAVTEPLLA
jgi:hypothetical protein